MISLDDPLCVHCEQHPSVTALALYADCHAVKSIHGLYLRRRGWTPACALHLRRLTARDKQRLPLCPRKPSSD